MYSCSVNFCTSNYRHKSCPFHLVSGRYFCLNVFTLLQSYQAARLSEGRHAKKRGPARPRYSRAARQRRPIAGNSMTGWRERSISVTAGTAPPSIPSIAAPARSTGERRKIHRGSRSQPKRCVDGYTARSEIHTEQRIVRRVTVTAHRWCRMADEPENFVLRTLQEIRERNDTILRSWTKLSSGLPPSNATWQRRRFDPAAPRQHGSPNGADRAALSLIEA
jgi:hypothetical protein